MNGILQASKRPVAARETGLCKHNLHPKEDSASKSLGSINQPEQCVSLVIHRTLQAISILSKKQRFL
jgi:hypothetical protein